MHLKVHLEASSSRLSLFLLDLVFSLVVKIVHLSLVTVQAVIQPVKPTGDKLQTKPIQWKVNCYRREQVKMVPARVFVRVFCYSYSVTVQ